MRTRNLRKPAILSPLKRLLGDRRGNVLAITAAAMPLLLGSVGLATDTVQWALWKRQLQRAADSAAFAGAYARLDEESSRTAVDRDLENNNHLWVALRSGFPVVTDHADSSSYTAAVTVSLSVQQPLTFSSMFLSSAPIITVNATAAAIDVHEFCVVGLDESPTNPAVVIQGSTTVNLGCGIISNSRHPSRSVNPNGANYELTAEPVAGAGGVPDMGDINTIANHAPQPDPYKNKYSTDIPSGMNCTNQNQKIVNPAPTPGVTTLAPGCYTGQNAFKFTTGTYHLQPGVYYLNGSDFDATGGTITGTGVTIILTGTTPGAVKLNGNATVQLTAPTSGAYAKMLLIQSANAIDSANTNNTINGTAASYFDGAFYFPKQQVNFSGTAGNMTKCAMVVAKRVNFAGNSNIQNNTVGCTANSKVLGKSVRLIG
jgi:Flp pilus assembly protein TadG